MLYFINYLRSRWLFIVVTVFHLMNILLLLSNNYNTINNLLSMLDFINWLSSR